MRSDINIKASLHSFAGILVYLKSRGAKRSWGDDKRASYTHFLTHAPLLPLVFIDVSKIV